jgi:hypothetical protein
VAALSLTDYLVERSWDVNPPTSAASWSRPPSWTG